MNLFKSFQYRINEFLINQKLNRREIYFIISTGRTGTNFMESFLNQASHQVYCVHEPQPDLFNISIQKVRNKIPSDVIQEKIKYHRKSEFQKFFNSGKLKYIESNPFTTFLIEELMTLFPAAKFLFIYRDIDTYLLSAMNKSPINNGVNNFYAPDDGRKRICLADFGGKEEEWINYTRSQKITWYWNKCNTELLSYQNKYQNKIGHIFYESMFSKSEELKNKTILEVLNFFNIEISAEKQQQLVNQTKVKKNQTKEKYLSSLDGLTELEKQFIKQHTLSLRNQLGYKSAFQF